MNTTERPEQTLPVGEEPNPTPEPLDVRAVPVKTESGGGGACHNPCNVDR
jgi:hypothetical protein